MSDEEEELQAEPEGSQEGSDALYDSERAWSFLGGGEKKPPPSPTKEEQSPPKKPEEAMPPPKKEVSADSGPGLFSKLVGSIGNLAEEKLSASPQVEKKRRKGAFEIKIYINTAEAYFGCSREISLGGKEPRLVRVKIPAGIRSGATLRVQSGDEKVDTKVAIEAHPYLELRGRNAYLKLPITLRESIEGV